MGKMHCPGPSDKAKKHLLRNVHRRRWTDVLCAKVTQTLSESSLRQGARDPLDQSAVGKVLGTGNSLRAEVMMSGKADDR
jgi:hypothetical protein